MPATRSSICRWVISYRDLEITEAAAQLATLIARPDVGGVINICSGRPVSVRALVEARVRQRQSSITLNLGHYGLFRP